MMKCCIRSSTQAAAEDNGVSVFTLISFPNWVTDESKVEQKPFFFRLAIETPIQTERGNK